MRRPRTARVRTWEVAEEGDGGGAADDGVDPEPPPGPEDGAGDARATTGQAARRLLWSIAPRWPPPTPTPARGETDWGRGDDLFSLVLESFSIVILLKG